MTIVKVYVHVGGIPNVIHVMADAHVHLDLKEHVAELNVNREHMEMTAVEIVNVRMEEFVNRKLEHVFVHPVLLEQLVMILVRAVSTDKIASSSAIVVPAGNAIRFPASVFR